MKASLSRARVGSLILLGVIITVAALFLVGEKSQLFSSTFIIRCNFESAEGVKPGTFVVMAGYNVGAVTDIELTSRADSVCVTMRISEDVHKFIKADSRAVIKQEGLVGNKYLNILIGDDRLPPIEPNGFVQSIPPFALGALADNVSAITDTTKMLTGQLHRMVGGLNGGRGTVGRLLNDPALYEQLLALVQETEHGLRMASQQLVKMTEMLASTSHSVDVLARSADSTLGSATRVTTEVETLVRNLNRGRGTVGALLNDRALYDSLTTLLGALSDVTYDAAAATDQIAKSVHAMRGHWLLGRVFGGDDYDKEPLPESAYQSRLKALQRRSLELDQREQRLRELEARMKSDRGEGTR